MKERLVAWRNMKQRSMLEQQDLLCSNRSFLECNGRNSTRRSGEKAIGEYDRLGINGSAMLHLVGLLESDMTGTLWGLLRDTFGELKGASPGR